jgi:hypothetical protein
MSFMDFTHCQAARYEMCTDCAAADIEPVAAIASSSAILLGASMAPFANLRLMRKRGFAMPQILPVSRSVSPSGGKCQLEGF